MSLQRFCVVSIIFLAGGCGEDRVETGPKTLPDAPEPGVYAGVFPCDGCPGIATTLWLRADGRFFFRQHYPADDIREATDAYSLGRWSSLVDEPAIELRGKGPVRTLVRVDADTLVMRTDSDLPHRLSRDPTTTDFTETIRMTGTMRMRGDAVSFAECLTGLVAPVSRNGDFARFRHQYRSLVASGEPAFVELDGRFSWSADHALASLLIERFITIKAGGTC